MKRSTKDKLPDGKDTSAGLDSANSDESESESGQTSCHRVPIEGASNSAQTVQFSSDRDQDHEVITFYCITCS
jgi:hypothetical protein